MSINKPIEIEKLNETTEEWKKYYNCQSEINKISGKEYFSSASHKTQNTFNFKIRFNKKLEDILFNYEKYRILYNNNIFKIINVDDFKLKHINLILIGEFNG